MQAPEQKVIRPFTYSLIEEELKKIKARYSKDYNSRHEGYAILKEEVDELWDEIKRNGSKRDLQSEAVQVAAVAIRFIQELTY